MWSLIELTYDLIYQILRTADDVKWEALAGWIVYQLGRRNGMRLFRRYLEGHFPYLQSEEVQFKAWTIKQILKLGGEPFLPLKEYRGATHSRKLPQKNLNISWKPLLRATNREGKRMLTVICDAGHGGIPGTKKADTGAIGTSGRYEKDFNLYVVNKVAELLKDHPTVKVILTRSTDVFLELKERTTFANKAKADIFISFHANSFGPTSTGTETHYTHANSKRLAEVMQKAQLQATGLKDRGLKVGKLYVTKNTKMPSCLLEPGYISNPSEDALLFDPVFMDKYAESIARGICEYFDVSFEDKNTLAVITPTSRLQGFLNAGVSYVPARPVLDAIGAAWGLNGKQITINQTPVETVLVDGMSYIKAKDIFTLGAGRIFFDNATAPKELTIYPPIQSIGVITNE